MHLATLLTISLAPWIAIASPARVADPPVGPTLTVPALVPYPIATQIASAISDLPVSIPLVSAPTAAPINPADLSELIPGLSISPEELFYNIEAALDILGLVLPMLNPVSAVAEEIGELGLPGLDGIRLDGKLITTLVNLAATLLELPPAVTPILAETSDDGSVTEASQPASSLTSSI